MPDLDDLILREQGVIAAVGWPTLPSAPETGAAQDDAAVEAAGTRLRALLAELRAAGDDGADGALARELLTSAEPVLHAVAESVGGSDSDEWSAGLNARIDAGESVVMRDDEVFQSADWDRASGRQDGTFELDGE